VLPLWPTSGCSRPEAVPSLSRNRPSRVQEGAGVQALSRRTPTRTQGRSPGWAPVRQEPTPQGRGRDDGGRGHVARRSTPGAHCESGMCQVSTVSKLVPVKAQPGENCTSLRVVPVGNQAGMFGISTTGIPREYRGDKYIPAGFGGGQTLAADMAARLVSAHKAGAGWSEIARRLNAEAVPTAHGGERWHPSTVRAVVLAHT
jgi:hypothetical protein